jgi:hypothetical protein
MRYAAVVLVGHQYRVKQCNTCIIMKSLSVALCDLLLCYTTQLAERALDTV